MAQRRIGNLRIAGLKAIEMKLHATSIAPLLAANRRFTTD
jgi:hypothetical protein